MANIGDSMCEDRGVKYCIDQITTEIYVKESIENEPRDMQEMGGIWKTEKDW